MVRESRLAEPGSDIWLRGKSLSRRWLSGKSPIEGSAQLARGGGRIRGVENRRDNRHPCAASSKYIECLAGVDPSDRVDGNGDRQDDVPEPVEPLR